MPHRVGLPIHASAKHAGSALLWDCGCDVGDFTSRRANRSRFRDKTHGWARPRAGPQCGGDGEHEGWYGEESCATVRVVEPLVCGPCQYAV